MKEKGSKTIAKFNNSKEGVADWNKVHILNPYHGESKEVVVFGHTEISKNLKKVENHQKSKFQHENTQESVM